MDIRVHFGSQNPIQPTSDQTFILLLNTMGVSIILEVFRSASIIFLKDYVEKPRTEDLVESRKCLSFIENGTGLEKLIKDYGLNYDADRLRDTFHWVVHKA